MNVTFCENYYFFLVVLLTASIRGRFNVSYTMLYVRFSVINLLQNKGCQEYPLVYHIFQLDSNHFFDKVYLLQVA